MGHPAIKNISFTPFTHSIEFPNGKGFTPCTKEYYDLYHEKKELHDPASGESLDDLPPADYQRWCVMDNKIMLMLLEGHLGKSVWH